MLTHSMKSYDDVLRILKKNGSCLLHKTVADFTQKLQENSALDMMENVIFQ